MDKFSLYEFLSFVVPGFIALQIVEFFNSSIFEQAPLLSFESNIQESFVLFCLSLFAGIFVHIITFKMIKYRWYEQIIYKSTQDITLKSTFIQRVIPFLNDDYKKTRRHEEKDPKGNESAPNLFDFAYYYLETNDKITPAKNFQSLYFWLRNMFTLFLMTIPVIFLLWLGSFFIESIEDKTTLLFCFLISITAITIIVVPMANWLREKLVSKIFWGYYVERVHQINESN